MINVQASSSGNGEDTNIAPDPMSLISDYIDNLSTSLRHLSLRIHDNPELRNKEFVAHEAITSFVAEQEQWDKKWTVIPSAYGIATAFVAVFDNGAAGPVVSFNAEYDALAGLGHACGHNLIAVASVGAALAAADVMVQRRLGGKVVLYGTPAEEGGGGKIRLLDAGAYRDYKVDVSLMAHPGVTPDAALVRTAAYYGMKVNALDALITAYNAVSVLRQQTQPGDIIQSQITNGGLKPNIIHAYSSGQFVVRSATKARLDALKARVIQCLTAGAVATGARLTITPSKYSYQDHVPSRALGSTYRRHFNTLGGCVPHDYTAVTQASTDQGNVSHALPSLHANFWIDSEGGGPHTADFERAARNEDAHNRAMRVAKSLAATAVDVLANKSLLEEVRREFKDSELLA